MCKARLGLKAGATAWLEGAQACQNARPGPSTWLKPGHGSAQAQGRGSLVSSALHLLARKHVIFNLRVK